MTFKKETFIFITCLALILIIGYVNVVMSNQAADVEPVLDDIALEKKQEEFADYTDITSTTDLGENDAATEVSSNSDTVDISFENFKIGKAKNNLEIVDQLEKSISSDVISADTRARFEELLVVKNNQMQLENSIEIMLKSKGYEDAAVVISNNVIKVVVNKAIEKADATKILDVVISESNYKVSQIKIVKFDNKEL